MARKRSSNGNGTTVKPQVPEGFGISVGRERGDGWATKEDGNEVQGRLLGRHTYKDKRGKTRGYYQIKLTKPCKADIEDPNASEDDEDAPRITVEMEEGKIVNVDETAKFVDLEPYTKNGGVYDVWFVYGNKVEIGGGQSMWEVTGPRLRVVNKPSETPDQAV